MGLVAGFGGGRHDACVALCQSGGVVGICRQERVTRVRGAGVNRSGLPDEALDLLLHRAGLERSDVIAYAGADAVQAPRQGGAAIEIDHHLAHACSAFLASPYDSATIVVCDHEPPQISVWRGEGSSVTGVDWPWDGSGFAELYSQCCEALGFSGPGREQRVEALARLEPFGRIAQVDELFSVDPNRIHLTPNWQARLEQWSSGLTAVGKARIAAAVQSRIGELVVEFLAQVKDLAPSAHLCLGGSLFYNTRLNSIVKCRGPFEHVFVPIDSGNAGLAAGAALYAGGPVRHAVTPFSGPAYTSEEIKAIFDNCKLTYQWASESDAVAMAAEALVKGRLVGWFDGPMEWGARALGGRSILANPFAPFVLDNLNHFLKQREVWRGYALSGLQPAVHDSFDGPSESPFMECDYAPRDRVRFRHVLPGLDAAVRVHTVSDDGPRGFRHLLEEFGRLAELPILVNTSFNGFHEPIVCSPRDAVRVFFGTGIDLLVCGEFVVTK